MVSGRGGARAPRIGVAWATWPLSSTLRGLIRSRFDQVSMPPGDCSVLIVEGLDQASVRALLTLLWDAGHEIRSLTPLT